MQNLNIDLLKKNINALLQSKRLTQEVFAEEIGMSQSNLSKALNPNNKKCFTVDQLFRISQYFGVSIDELMGNDAPNANYSSPQFIFSLLAKFLLNRTAKFIPVEIEEESFQPYQCDYGWDCHTFKEKTTYQALYFPDFIDPAYISHNEDEYYDILGSHYQAGNVSNFVKMNKLLTDLLKVHNLYADQTIPKDTFETIIKAYIDQLKE